MKNNDFEEDRTRRGEKKDNKDDKKREDEFSKCFESVRPWRYDHLVAPKTV